MSTQAPSKGYSSIRLLRKQLSRGRQRSPTEHRHLDRPYDLTVDGYRVVLGCCSQTDSNKHLATGRPRPVQAETTSTVKEVKS